MASLVQLFLSAPADQVDPRVIEKAKTSWATPVPTEQQCNETLVMMGKYPCTAFARRIMHAIRLEAVEAQFLAFDTSGTRPLEKK